MTSSTYVYIVESPGPDDFFDGRTEGRALCEALSAIGARHSYTVATDLKRFVQAFDVSSKDGRFLSEMAGAGNGCPPIVHLSMHGNEDGIVLADGTTVRWHELREILMPINSGLPVGLMVCLSTCQGALATRLSMYEDGSKPFYGTVGSYDSVSWSDALVGFVTFYHLWGKGLTIADIVERMKAASNHDGFAVHSGAEEKRKYIEYAQRRRVVDALIQPSPDNGGPLFGLGIQGTEETDAAPGIAGLGGLGALAGTKP